MTFRIDHLGIAVIAGRGGEFTKLGLSVSAEETVEQEMGSLVMVPVARAGWVLEATSEDSTIARFIAKRGEDYTTCACAFGSGRGSGD